MIVTITLNPCIDKSTRTASLKPEAKLRCTEVKNEPGGGGINVTKALQRLNIPSVALFPAGGNNGNMLKELLSASAINYYAIDSKAETRENWIVVTEESQQQYRFTFPGRNVDEQSIIALIDAIKNYTPSFVVASGSLPPGLPEHFYGLIVKTAAAVNAKCIIDTSGVALQAIKNKKAYIIKPNISELQKMLHVDGLKKNEVDDAAQQAVADGFAEIIVVSMGGDGAWLVTKEEKYFVAAPPVTPKSTVGAGDSMVAGITHALHKNLSLQEALQWGVACGSAATMNEGTELFKLSDAQHLYQLISQS